METNFSEVAIIDNSAFFKEIAYDKENGLLKVSFKTGATYTYQNVPSSIWQGLKIAPSKGKYYASNIRGKFDLYK